MPVRSSRQCAAIVDHDKLAVLGRGGSQSRRFFLYRKSTRKWDIMPDMLYMRNEPCCGAIDSRDGTGRYYFGI